MIRRRDYFFIVILFFSITFQLHGQNNYSGKLKNFDSLSKLEQVKLLSKLSWKYREKQTNKAIEYGLQGIKIAKAEGFRKQLARLYGYMGVIYQDYKYDIPTAMSYFDKCLPISLRVRDSVEIAYVYNDLGDAFYTTGNIPLAFEYGRKSLAMFERLKNLRGIAYSYINMGEVNRKDGKYVTALHYFRKAIALRKTFDDSVGIASANLEVAQTLFRMGQTDSAMHYFRVSLEKHRRINNKDYMAYSMQGMGGVFLKRNELDSACLYYKKALKLCRERQNPTGEIISQLGIAKVMALTGKEKEGEKVLNKALSNAEKSKITPNILKVFKAKGEFYLQLGEFRKASENYQNYIHTYDSLFSVLQFQTLSEIRTRFRMMKKLNSVRVHLKANQRDVLYAVLLIILLLVFAIVLFLRNRTIARLSSELRQSDQSKDKIFSIISHDLVSPFNVLMGTSELLMEDIKEKDLEGAKNKGALIQRTSEETYYFISNLLHWARSQRKSIQLHPETFDMSRLMHEMRSTLSNQAKLKDINVNINAAPDLKVKADKNLIQIVLMNLLNNAVKFTHNGGTVDLSLEKEDDRVRVSVKDNGIGIPPDRIDLLFKDQAVDSSPGTRNEKGTGLGLLLCKEFVEMHGSEIYVNSREEEGSEFWFMLPVA